MCIIDYCRHKTKLRLMRGEHVHWVHGHKRSSYLVAAVLSFPLWIKGEAFRALIQERDEKTKVSGIQYVLDHIIPINHPRVCGLSVPWNIQVITSKQNSQKGADWCEWHGELFPDAPKLVRG